MCQEPEGEHVERAELAQDQRMGGKAPCIRAPRPGRGSLTSPLRAGVHVLLSKDWAHIELSDLYNLGIDD